MSSKKDKRAAEKAVAKQKDLKKQLAAERGQLTRTEKKLAKAKDRADRWKAEAKAQRTSAARATAKVEKMERKRAEAAAALRAAPRAVTTQDDAPESAAVAQAADADVSAVPDESWTVVQLRAEARARGLTGTSNHSKAKLLAALT